MSKSLRYIISLIILSAVAGGTWAFITYYEGEKPVIALKETFDRVGQQKVVHATLSDQKSGLRTATVTIAQDGKTHTLDSIAFPEKGTTHTTMRVDIDCRKLKLHDGSATFVIKAIDYSLRKNVSEKTITVIVDTSAPQIFHISTHHYINEGGSCIVLYSISEDIANTYVYVNDEHFLSYPITISDKPGYICYFAIPTDGKTDSTRIGIAAQDLAGNTSKSTVPIHVRKKRFRGDNMYISKGFLERKMPEFQQTNSDIVGLSLVESFIFVNETLRERNLETVQSICSTSHGSRLWDGPFLRMRNAATMATFGDRRTYYYRNKKISKSIHLGVDLASTKNAPVEASNSGIVVFSGYLGIYGNTVIIDHGLGLFSFYAHLGTTTVTKGQKVRKGLPIGRSDTSGLAGGDHLHFGIFVGKRFVNPQEWWDAHWIRDNVERKLNVNF